jgi:hypothetical protein
MTVTFNTPVISKGSQEFLLATTVHEIFHAYLDANPSILGTLNQHTYMFLNFISGQVATLQKVFPKLSEHDADCLVLAGFQDMETTTLFNGTLLIYGLSVNDVSTTNNNYKSGAVGATCTVDTTNNPIQ